MEFLPGQTWSYGTREGEGSSRVLILFVSELPNNTAVIHVALNNLQIKTADEAAPLTHIRHLPMTAGALETSCIAMLDTIDDLPDVSEALAEWQRLFDEGSAGVWESPLRDVVQAIESAMCQQVMATRAEL